MKAKHRRTIEGLKTLLIVVLGCSAIFLASQTLFPTQGAGLLTKLPTADSQTVDSSQSRLYSQLLHPAAFAVTWSEGRYGQLYHQESQEGYTALLTPLAEALSVAGAPTAVSQDDWQEALHAPGLYCEYLGSIPLDAFSRWLSGSGNEQLAGYSAQRLCVTAGQLYFVSGEDASVYAAPLSPTLSDALNQLFAQFTPNGARFAAEATDIALRADALILDTTPILPALTGECPISATLSGEGDGGSYTPNDALFSILQKLSFHPQTNPLYAVGDGWAITDASETLRISSSGLISYRRSDFSTLRYPFEESALEFTKELVEATLAPLAGSGYLYLAGMETSGAATTITYGYAFRGARIDLDDTLWCASFTFEQGTLSAFTLRPRRYSVLEGGDVALLPQRQAAAALGETSRSMGLGVVYADRLSGEAIKPFWAAKEG